MLRKHQIEGAEWLLRHPRGYLADAPRVGKTRTLLHALQLSDSRKALIIVPAMVRTHWRREADALGVNPGRYEILSYDAVVRGGDAMQARYKQDGVDTLILDEAHFLKNRGAQRTRRILGRDGYRSFAPRIWFASGTPIPKNPSEIYMALGTIDPLPLLHANVLTYNKFVAKFCVIRRMNVRGRWVDKIVTGKNLDELKTLMAPMMLRRTLADLHSDVPTLDWQQMELGTDLYGAVAMQNLARAVHTNDFATLVTPVSPRRELGVIKAQIAGNMLADQLQGTHEKVAVFAYHRDALSELRDRLSEFHPAYIDGDTSESQRDWELSRFQNDETCRVFIGQSKACEVGIRLDAADTAIILEPSWTAMDNVQLANRIVDAERPGRRCVVQMVSLAGTLDDAIVATNRRESEMAAKLFAQ